MSWKQKFGTAMTEALRMFWRVCVAIDVILISIFSVWLVSKALLRLMGFLNRTIFCSSSW